MIYNIFLSDYIQIGNRWYRIKLVPDIYKQEGKSVYGYTNYLAGEIIIEANLQYDHQVEVLIHEIFHVIEDLYSIAEGDETVKQCMAIGWTQVLGNLGIKFEFPEKSNSS